MADNIYYAYVWPTADSPPYHYTMPVSRKCCLMYIELEN
jgi:hypothetical protein